MPARICTENGGEDGRHPQNREIYGRARQNEPVPALGTVRYCAVDPVLRRSALSIATLEQICGALDLTLSQFFFDPETETRYPLTESQRRMVDKWAALTPEQQRILMELIEYMQKQNDEV